MAVRSRLVRKSIHLNINQANRLERAELDSIRAKELAGLALTLEERDKLKEENETIGILLCAEKNNAVIKYTLPEKQKQIFISKYIPYLPSEDELKNEIMKEKEQFDMEKKLLRGNNE